MQNKDYSNISDEELEKHMKNLSDKIKKRKEDINKEIKVLNRDLETLKSCWQEIEKRGYDIN